MRKHTPSTYVVFRDMEGEVLKGCRRHRYHHHQQQQGWEVVKRLNLTPIRLHSLNGTFHKTYARP